MTGALHSTDQVSSILLYNRDPLRIGLPDPAVVDRDHNWKGRLRAQAEKDGSAFVFAVYVANYLKVKYPSYPSPYLPTSRLISSLALGTQKISLGRRIRGRRTGFSQFPHPFVGWPTNGHR